MFFKKVVKTIKKYQMIKPGEHIIAGISGGADSVALLLVLNTLKQKWRLSLTVAHLNHGLRGDVSQKEAAFVRELAQQMSLRFILGHKDVLGYRREKGGSIQDAARAVRYQFFYDTMMQMQAQKIALGHHANDQAETVLMWFIRGTSLDGLGGIPPVRDGIIIRPLIEVSRDEIEHYLQKHNIRYIPDISVHEDQYLRNNIRHKLIPVIQRDFNPQIVSTLAQLSELLRGDKAILCEVVKDVVDKNLLIKAKEEAIFPVNELTKHPKALQNRIIRYIFTSLKGDSKDITFKHIESIVHLLYTAGSSKRVHLPGGWCVLREYAHLVFKKYICGRIHYHYCFENLPQRITINEIKKEIFFEIGYPSDKGKNFLDKSSNIEYLNYDAIKFPLIVRNFLSGDFFYPLGMSRRKKLKDFFIDEKVPARKRKTIPILLCKDQVAWVAGMRIDNRFRLRADTKRVLKVRIT